MRIKRPIPANRTEKQLRRHYEVEKSLASRLLRTTRSERSEMYRSMYDELFRQVPDHPRRVRRDDLALVRDSNAQKLALISRFLDRSKTIVEFGPGDCAFATEVASRAQFVYGVDISDQRTTKMARAENFKLIVYDGYTLEIEENSIDVVLSDQLIEHLHPDDTRAHFVLARKILSPGGIYVLRTPHRYNGPHDISKFFSNDAEGFHLKEWTYTELESVLSTAGYSSWRGYWHARKRTFRCPCAYFRIVESLLKRLPHSARSLVSRMLLPNVVLAAVK